MILPTAAAAEAAEAVRVQKSVRLQLFSILRPPPAAIKQLPASTAIFMPHSPALPAGGNGELRRLSIRRWGQIPFALVAAVGV